MTSKISKLHFDSIVVDGHHDILIDVLESRDNGNHRRLDTYWGPKLREGGVNVQVFPMYVFSGYLPEMALRETLRMTEAFLQDVKESNENFEIALTYDDIMDAVGRGKIASILAIEGAEGIGNNIELFETFYRLGLRMVSLTWNHRNAFADGTGEQETKSGLTKLGFAAIKEFNRLGIIVDVSHINETCFFDVLETTSKPVVASHSNARGIYDHPRNLSDDQIKALAKNGGVMGLLIHPGIIDPKDATISRCVDHIEYVCDLVGVDHIGLGTDFTEDNLAGPITEAMAKESMIDIELLRNGIPGMNKIQDLPGITAEMERRNFSETDIKKILGGNLLRVYKQVLK